MKAFFSSKIILFILLVAILGWAMYWFVVFSEKQPEIMEEPAEAAVPAPALVPETTVAEPQKIIRPLPPPPPPPSMERMKREGCVADGLLNGDFPKDGKTIELVNNSKCYYLSRAIETWLEPPDWKDIDENRAKLRADLLPGMFLAEAIDIKRNYYYPDEGRDFDFGDMCRKGSKNFWGEHTCKPSFAREEYRKYVRFITRAAMDRNIQVFLIGQVYHQDAKDQEDTIVPEVVADMRQYAAIRGMTIFIGAQTNDIDNPEYLKLFDFIEGGVGIDAAGNIESGPCFSRWWKKEGDWCWGLLWHERFAKNARNVFLHFDWSGKIGDDMSTYTRMDAETRARTVRKLYGYFTERGMGFLLPYVARLHVDNGGCYGPAKRYYTPDNRFGCKDEAVMNELLQKARATP